ncbi:MAG TPA: Hsp20/alpha crystallin family protein [Pseudoneobacillus sp.]|nr:Hsp20/alpha crystallin family protein [Pseudoneobacillus sp.]
MYSNENKGSFDPDEKLEKWLESLFLDPNTSLLDQTQFRIDLYDSETEIMIEALLPNYTSSHITVYIDVSQVIIKACKTPNHTRERTVEFPFTIYSQMVSGSFCNDILEISISKKHMVQPKTRFITLT